MKVCPVLAVDLMVRISKIIVYDEPFPRIYSFWNEQWNDGGHITNITRHLSNDTIYLRHLYNRKEDQNGNTW